MSRAIATSHQRLLRAPKAGKRAENHVINSQFYRISALVWSHFYSSVLSEGCGQCKLKVNLCEEVHLGGVMILSGFLRRYRSFRKGQNGNATIEFVFLFPVFIFLFLTGFESGYFMVRNVMLERAVDVAIRDVRLGNGNVPDFDDMKLSICQQAAIIPDCVNSVQVEMQSIAITPGSTTALRAPARCVDRASTDDSITGTTFDVGLENQMMMVRVCALMQPLFPSTGIGVGMRVDAEGNYAIVATTGFVNEPGNRSGGS